MKKILLLAAGLVVLAGLAVAQAQQPAPPANPKPEDAKYTNESVARVSFVSGKVFLQRASDLGYEDVVVNTPISEGDRLNTGEGRAEIQFGQRNFLRLDENTKIDVLNLPKKGDDKVRLRVWSGSAYVEINSLAKEKSIEIHTADTSFYVLDRGLFRVDVKGDQTELLVFRGLVEAAGEEGSTLVKAEQRIEVAEGRFLTKPSAFMTAADDGFDRWNNERSDIFGRPVAKKHLSGELEEFEGELDEYGDWTYVAPYGDVWVPRNMPGNWQPYLDGRWSYIPISGWTWLPYERWGWAPYHYGRWHWGVGLGWYWIPMNFWGPAWVDWWYDDYYFGWAPMSWWGFPTVIVDGIFYDRHGWDRYPWNSRSLTVVRRDQLRNPSISQVAIRDPNVLKGLGDRMVLTNRPLNLRPSGSGGVTVQEMGGKRILRENGRMTGLREPGAATSGRTLRPLGGGSGNSGKATTKGGKVTSGSMKPSGKSSSGKSSSGKSSSGRSSSGRSSSGRSSGGGSGVHKKFDAAPSLPSPANVPGLGQGRSYQSRSIVGYPSSRSITGTGFGRTSESPWTQSRSSSMDRIMRSFNGGSYSGRSLSPYSYRSPSSSYSRGSSVRSYSGSSGRSFSGGSYRGGSIGGSTRSSGSSGGGLHRK